MATNQIISSINVDSTTDDNKVPTYDAASDTFVMETPAGSIPRFYQDFVAPYATSAFVVDGPAYGAVFDEATGSSGQLDVVATTGVYGCAVLSQPTTPAANENSWWGSGGISTLEPSLNPIFECSVKGDSNNNEQRIVIGFLDIVANAANSADTDTAANEIMFRRSSAGTYWESVTRSGSGTEVVNISSTTTTGWHTLKIVVNSSTSVDFYIDGTLHATHTTGLPTSSTPLGWYFGNGITSTNNRSLYIDYVKLY